MTNQTAMTVGEATMYAERYRYWLAYLADPRDRLATRSTRYRGRSPYRRSA